jgi:hypothetical protein
MIVVEKFIFKLNNCFLTNELMDSLGVVYPHFWLSLNTKGSFQHLNVIKFVYYVPKKHGLATSSFWTPLVLDPTTFSLFALKMKNNCHVAMVELHNHNPLIRLWRQLIPSLIVVH